MKSHASGQPTFRMCAIRSVPRSLRLSGRKVPSSAGIALFSFGTAKTGCAIIPGRRCAPKEVENLPRPISMSRCVRRKSIAELAPGQKPSLNPCITDSTSLRFGCPVRRIDNRSALIGVTTAKRDAAKGLLVVCRVDRWSSGNWVSAPYQPPCVPRASRDTLPKFNVWSPF